MDDKPSNRPQDAPTVPADDLGRNLALARPNEDEGLRRVSEAGDTYTILSSGEDTAGCYTLIDVHVPPGGGPPPRLRGDVSCAGGRDRGHLPRREVGRADRRDHKHPGQRSHSFTNASERPARLPCVCAPPGEEHFFEAIGDPVASRMAARRPSRRRPRRGTHGLSSGARPAYQTELP